MRRRIVGNYAVQVRCNEVSAGCFKSAYIVERLPGAGKKYFVMISLLETFDDRDVAIERAMARGFNHAQWLNASLERIATED